MEGVPQGSILAPALFIFFITKMTHSIEKHISFTDDLTMWLITIDHRKGCAKLGTYVGLIKAWCRRWRMRMTIPNTDVMWISNMTDYNVLGVHHTQADEYPKMFGCDIRQKAYIQCTY